MVRVFVVGAYKPITEGKMKYTEKEVNEIIAKKTNQHIKLLRNLIGIHRFMNITPEELKDEIEGIIIQM